MLRKLSAFSPITLALAASLSLLTTAGCGSGGATAAGTTSAGTPALSLSASALTFTSAIGVTTAAQTITVTNTGSATAIFSATPSLTGAGSSAFFLTSACSSSLAASTSCTLSVTFTPAAATTYTAAVNVSDNAANSPQTVALTGTGNASSTVPTATLSATSLTFSAASATTSAAQTITLSNSGTATLNITSLTLGGTNSAAFSYTTTCAATLATASSCTLAIKFAPTSVATFNATLTLVTNATPATQVITLMGTGTTPTGTPNASVSSNAVTFPNTVANTTSAPQTVTLANSGTGPLSITGISVTGIAFAQTNTCGTSVNAGSACVLSFTFSPNAAGPFTGTVSIIDNAANSPQTVTLSGTGTAAAPVVTLSATGLTFPATTINTAATTQAVTITNTGSATLTGLSLSLSGAAAFTQTSTCPASLAINASCTATVGFTPTAAASYAGTLSIADNATGAPQTVTLSGTGQVAPAPIATLSATSITFPAQLIATTSAASTVSLTNSGNATLNIASITLGGTNPTFFATTNTCGTSLAAAATCTISATFTPVTATTYTATITLTTNAAASPQVITLSGTGTTTASTVTRTFFVIPEADNSVTPLYTLINSAKKTIDMTMYEMQDTTFLNDLIARCNAGVTVRVIFSSSVASSSASSLTALNATPNCKAVDSNTAFTNTHQKTITVDNTTTAILSLNLQQQYYSTTRDYGLIENDVNDIAAIEATFAQDFAAAGTNSATEFAYQPQPGDDLVWSPTTATADMLAIINNATKTLYIENEEFSASNIVSAVQAAAQRGVAVIFIGESTSYLSNFAIIKAAGASVYYYTSSTGFYIHGKTVVADLGLATEAVYMGSINYSTASLTQNRELGVYFLNNTTVSNPIAATIAATVISDESQPGVTKY